MFVFYLTLVFLIIIIFIGCLGSSLLCAGFCLVVVSRGLIFVAMCGLLTEVASLAAELSCQGPAGLVAATCGLWRVDSGVVVHRLSCFGVSDQTDVLCIGRWIPNYCTAREIPWLYFRKTTFIVLERVGWRYSLGDELEGYKTCLGAVIV